MVLALGPIVVGFIFAVFATLLLAGEASVRLIAGAGRLGKAMFYRK